MDKSVGIELQKARQALGMGLPEVSSALCISKTYLRGLEESQEADLPAPAFTIGFLRTYADYLGLDADDLVQRAKAGFEGDEPAPSAPANVPEKAPDSSMPAAPLVMSVLGGVLSLGLAFGFMGASDNVASAVDAQAPSTAVSVEPANEAPAPTLNEDNTLQQETVTALASTSSSPEVEIVADGAAWVSVRDDQNRQLFEDVLEKGERVSIPVAGQMHLATGNAGSLSVYVDGEKLSPPVSDASVVHDWVIAGELEQTVADYATTDY